MAKAHVKGVRTRFKNTLESEIETAKELLNQDLMSGDLDDNVARITKCAERIKVYVGKLEAQSEKMLSEMEEEDESDIEKILDEDCRLCSDAISMSLDLNHFKERLMAGKEETEERKRPVPYDESKTNQIVELQKDMQDLFERQLKQQELALKSASDKFSSVKLPKIEIPVFSGNKTKWTEFWDSFQCAVHNNKKINDVEKFNYLKGKLVGDAKCAIAGLALTNGNYKVAVDILRKRFGNTQEIINQHYSQMMSLQPASNQVGSLRTLLDNVEQHLRSLEVLHQNTDQDVFVSMIRSKLPEDVLMQLEIQNGVDKKWNVFSLCEKLRAYVVARERSVKEKDEMTRKSELNSQSVKNSVMSRDRTSNGRLPKSSVHVLTADAPQSRFKGNHRHIIKNCRFCAGNHWSDECAKYKTISERKDRIKGSCYKCLKTGHIFKECKSQRACVYCGEMNVHHRSLCTKKFKFKPTIAHTMNEVEQENEAVLENMFMSMNETILMQTALTTVSNPSTDDKVPVRLLMDSGSNRSYMTESLAQRLKLREEGEEDVHLVTFGSKTAKKVTTKYAKVKVKQKNGKYTQLTVNIVPFISGDLQRKPVKYLLSDRVQDIVQTVELADVIPTERENSPIELLIGNDYYLDIIHGDKIEIQPGLYLLASKLGWIISGRTSKPENNEEQPTMFVQSYGTNVTKTSVFTTIDQSLPTKRGIEDFWNVESIGIMDDDLKTDDASAMDNFKETLKFEDSRYHVTWPWKQPDPDLPTNKELTLGRLKSTVTSLNRKPGVLQMYDNVIADQLQKGVIEKVKKSEPDGLVHYIPHHAVITPDKTTTKIRVVYDASAKSKKENLSLNECLYRGPVMLNDLCGILMRFRLHPIAVVADVEKAFLQIGLQKDQRDVTRFLWLKNVDDPKTDKHNIEEYRFKRVPFGVISSPFLLGDTIESHLIRFEDEIANKVKQDIYVDNLVTGVDTVTEAANLYNASKSMFDECSMNLREWVTNNNEAKEAFHSDTTEVQRCKVLGHQWNVIRDSLMIKVPMKGNCSKLTKRTSLKRLASVFDPLGILSPAVLPGKVFLQNLWRKDIGWDDPLDDDDLQRWLSISHEIDQISKCEFPRNISPATMEHVKYRLICFCDASEKAYAAVIYLQQSSNGDVTTNIVFAKTRLAPVKKVSIPRLELLAVLIGVKCLKFVKDNLKIPIIDSQLWTDSQCALHWIKSEKQLPVFVRNRVKEINDHSDVQLAYVPTTENPADVATRGTTVEKLENHQLWWHGPEWVSKPKREWPVFDIPSYADSSADRPETDPEVVLIQPEIQQQKNTGSPLDIDINRFSSVTKLLRVTALALRFIRKLKKRFQGNVFVTSNEIKESEELWLKHAQTEHFKDVQESIAHDRKCNIKKQLGVYRDGKGLLRCKGRLENADICENARLPILLPKTGILTELLIKRSHQDNLHSGVSQTLSAMRQRFWIPQWRSRVKAVLKSCVTCRRHEGGPYKLPHMCSLPKSRVTEAKPFSKVGLDYLGPIYTRTNGETKKVWICLFTCLVTRAIHLELVCDMSTSEFLLCFRRFISQKGTPSKIISDNAAQFRAASTVVDRVWNQIHGSRDVWSYVSDKGIHWTFNVELSPWVGGFYERLVGLVKRAMKKTIGRRLMTIIQIQTLLKEIESVLNSRPLVYVGDDVNSRFPITPSHFLTLNPNTGIPELSTPEDEDYQPYESTTGKLLNLWENGQKLLDMFWRAWRDDYLLSLRERMQTEIKCGRIKAEITPSVNDIVIIKDNCSRGDWKFGKITELSKSRDGLVRSASVLIPSGKVIRRPINLLYPLEAARQCETVMTDRRGSTTAQVFEETSSKHTRQAAEKARHQIKRILTD